MGRGRKEEEGEEFLRQRNQHVQRKSKQSVWSTEFRMGEWQEEEDKVTGVRFDSLVNRTEKSGLHPEGQGI